MLYRIPEARTQRAMMRHFFQVHGGDRVAVCLAYVEAERDGRVRRKSNDYGVPAEIYAKALFRSGVSQGWLFAADIQPPL